MKKFMALLKDKLRLHNIVANSDTLAGRVFDIAVMVAIVISLLVAFVETLPGVVGRFKDVLTVLAQSMKHRQGFFTVFV